MDFCLSIDAKSMTVDSVLLCTLWKTARLEPEFSTVERNAVSRALEARGSAAAECPERGSPPLAQPGAGVDSEDPDDPLAP